MTYEEIMRKVDTFRHDSMVELGAEIAQDDMLTYDKQTDYEITNPDFMPMFAVGMERQRRIIEQNGWLFEQYPVCIDMDCCHRHITTPADAYAEYVHYATGDGIDRVTAYNFCMATLAVRHEAEIICAFELESARIEAAKEMYKED